jgi:osmoprotectant transport system ATP-binding protein
VQYGTPDEILADPVNEFVADFVGADRGLKRLLLRDLADIELAPAPPNGADLLTVSEHTSLRDALSLMVTRRVSELLVVGDGDAPRGLVTMAALTHFADTADRGTEVEA